MTMLYSTFTAHINALVSDFLNEGGDPAEVADLLRDLADEIFEEPELEEAV